MNVHGKIVDDLRSSLSDLGEVLAARPDKKDPLLLKMHTDAKIYSFLYCNQIFDDLLLNILQSNVEIEAEDGDIPDPEHVVSFLQIVGEIDEKLGTSMMKQFEYAGLLVCDNSQFIGERADSFNDGVASIPQFYTAMSSFLSKVQTAYALYDMEDEDGF